jgi:hypothetical protein
LRPTTEGLSAATLIGSTRCKAVWLAQIRTDIQTRLGVLQVDGEFKPSLGQGWQTSDVNAHPAEFLPAANKAQRDYGNPYGYPSCVHSNQIQRERNLVGAKGATF